VTYNNVTYFLRDIHTVRECTRICVNSRVCAIKHVYVHTTQELGYPDVAWTRHLCYKVRIQWTCA